MPLEFDYHAVTTVPLEMDGAVQAAQAAASLGQIERWPVQHGNRRVPLAEFFRVGGTLGDGLLRFRGNLSGVHRLGAAMHTGHVLIEGDAGRHLGSGLLGGTIEVTGSARDWVGAEMRGGTIRVRGSVGNAVGAAYVGSTKGMRGGKIIVHGSAGDKLGHSMRRGLIAIGASAGEFPALDMIAGTVMVLGGCGQRPAAGMRRGTLAVFGPCPMPLPTFRNAGPCRPQFLRLYLQTLKRLGVAMREAWLDEEYVLYSGDQLHGGRGELLLRRGCSETPPRENGPKALDTPN